MLIGGPDLLAGNVPVPLGEDGGVALMEASSNSQSLPRRGLNTQPIFELAVLGYPASRLS
jgi:hypothetical protein